MNHSIPPTVEICTRLRYGLPCMGRIFRPQPDVAHCMACGGDQRGEVSVRVELVNTLRKPPDWPTIADAIDAKEEHGGNT